MEDKHRRHADIEHKPQGNEKRENMQGIRNENRHQQHAGQQKKADLPFSLFRKKQLDKKVTDQSLEKIGSQFAKLEYGIHKCLRKKPVMVSLTSFA